MTNLFLTLSFVLILATLLGQVSRWLKAPLLIGYLVTGLLFAAFPLERAELGGVFEVLPEIGFAFLLFLVGMELDFEEVRSVGKTIFLIGLSQIILTTLFGFLIASSFEFPMVSSLFLGLALSFSSTIVVVKLLVEQKNLMSLQGKLAVGVLLIEDLVAVTGLMLISLVGQSLNLGVDEVFFINLINFFLKAGLLFLIPVFLGRYLLPAVFKKTAESGELLFLSAITWCLVFVAVSLLLNFSSGIGAFLAGIVLANSDFRVAIVGKISPLRDFFIALFFIDLGTKINLALALKNLPLIFILVSYALIVKPSLFLLLLSRLGLKRHTFFKTASSLSSISEFSLILLLGAVSAGLISREIFSPFAAATVLAMTASTLLITHQERLYALVQKPLRMLEKNGQTMHDPFLVKKVNLKDHFVLLGCHRAGGVLLKRVLKFGKFKDKILVVDFDPKIIQQLNQKRIAALYGDISDPETLEQLKLHQAKIIVSTVRDPKNNSILLDFLKNQKIKKAKVFLTANDEAEAKILKTKGAHGVVVPEALEGEKLADILFAY